MQTIKNCKNIKFKPADLRSNVADECYTQKAKIAGFSALMFVVAGTYNGFYQNLIWRSMQHQELAMAGGLSFNTYQSNDDRAQFEDKIQLAVWEAKDVSELKRISVGGSDRDSDWKTQSINGVNYGPQGVTTDNEFYFEQTVRYPGYVVEGDIVVNTDNDDVVQPVEDLNEAAVRA